MQIIYNMLKLPHIPLAKDLIDKAYRQGAKSAKKIRGRGKTVPDKRLKGEMERVEKAASIIEGDLNAIVKYFPVFEDLPVFHQMLLDLKVDKNRYKKSLATVRWCSERVDFLKKKTLRKLRTQRDWEKSRDFLGRASSFVERIDKDLKYLIEVKKTLLSFPVLDEEAHTLVVAGAPNVGKSTFTKSLTGSKVKVASYPFTTVDLLVGKKKIRHTVYQIIDSPGILERPMSERNKVEKSAILALKYLAEKILFIIDPAQEMDAQLSLRDEIKNAFETEMFTAVNKKADVEVEDYMSFDARNAGDCLKVLKKCFGLNEDSQ